MNQAKRCQILKFAFAAKIFFVFCLIAAPVSASTRTLAKYRGGVRSAKLALENLIAPDAEDKSVRDFSKTERETLSEIRADVPASEEIEWQGATVQTDNRWLTQALNEYEQEQNLQKKKAILTAAAERLDALEQKLAELENPSVATRAKDEDKQKLAEILRREEFQKPEEKQESLFAKLYRKIMDWLAKMFPRADLPDAPNAEGMQSFSFVLQMLLYALILGVIAFLIYRFAPFFAARFKAREKRERTERVILGERLSDDETATNLFSEAERLARDGDLRGAIRKGYIALLCDLSDRKIIGLSRHKTNRDYLRDVRQKNELYKNMNGLTNNFERHWYGFQDAREADWEEFKNDYRRAVKTV